MIAKVALENGIVRTGESFGAEGEVTGEVVFNTSLSVYQEIFSDPSYNGQIVTMTYPLIGNYGVNNDDVESAKLFRTDGAMRGALSTVDMDDESLLAKVGASSKMDELDPATVVSCDEPHAGDEIDTTPFALKPQSIATASCRSSVFSTTRKHYPDPTIVIVSSVISSQ